MDATELYGLPLEQFVPERSSLVKVLRNQGRREEAAKIAGLKKPSVAAWAVNQLVRTQRCAMAELLGAGDALRQAQEDVLTGSGDARALRTAAERERAAAGALVTAAGGLLSSDGHQLSAAVLDRVAETLHAGALDEDARKLMRSGALERELRHVGLGGAGGFAVGSDAPQPADSAGRRPSERPADSPAPRTRRGERTARGRGASDGDVRADQDAAERAAADRAGKREQRDALKTARAAEAEAERRADRAARTLAVAQQRRQRAAQALSEAEAALHAADEVLSAARAEADRAAGAHRDALDQLGQR